MQQACLNPPPQEKAREKSVQGSLLKEFYE
jgi:hypothetical protein